MVAENTKALVKRRGAKLAQPSGRDVAEGCSTTSESASFGGLSKDKVIVSLLSMLQGLASNMLSQDAWFLSMLHARKLAEQNGVSDEDFMAIQEAIFEMQQKGKKSNPISSMF